MDSGGHGDLLSPRLHELQHARLPEDVMEDNAVRPEHEVALSGRQLLSFGIVEMAEQDLVGQRQWPVQPASCDVEVAGHASVNSRCHLMGRFDRHHCPSSVLPYS